MLCVAALPILWACFAWTGAAVRAAEPIQRLPAIGTGVTPTDWDGSTNLDWPASHQTGLPPADEPFLSQDYWQTSTRLSDRKEGFFQRLVFSATWIEGGRVDDLAITELELYATFAVPAPTRDHPLLITPGFATRWFDGPITPDLPAEVYSAYVQFMWLPRLSDRWTAILAISPGVYSDFQDGGNDPFRLLGRGLLRYDVVPERLQILGGVYYLDRDDVNILPVGGIVWNPTDDWRLDLVFPQPKIAYRFSCREMREDWIYLAGEFGGDSWAIQRADGSPDRVTMRDLRLLLGWELKRGGGTGIRLEAGYVFGRTFEYASATPDFEPSDALLVRGVVSY
jgi:hypothetical protein